MATLKEAVESGRRWKCITNSDDAWFGPGPEGNWPASLAIRDDWIIEPDKRCSKKYFGVRCERVAGHTGKHGGHAGNTSAEWLDEPEGWDLCLHINEGIIYAHDYIDCHYRNRQHVAHVHNDAVCEKERHEREILILELQKDLEEERSKLRRYEGWRRRILDPNGGW